VSKTPSQSPHLVFKIPLKELFEVFEYSFSNKDACSCGTKYLTWYVLPKQRTLPRYQVKIFRLEENVYTSTPAPGEIRSSL
jgi:hypothetical protein